MSTVAVIIFAAVAVMLVVLHRSFETQALARQATALNDEALRLQLDEETGMRGYVATHRPVFLEPYHEAAPKIAGTLDALVLVVSQLQLEGGPAAVADMQRLHDAWVRTVADPALTAPAVSDERQLRGKVLVDRFRDDSRSVQDAIDRRTNALEMQTANALGITALIALVAAVLVARAIVLARRLQERLSREHAVVETLQRAFTSHTATLPKIAVGSAYVAADEAANVGGDLFDIRRLDEHRGYVLIADVSGKGVNAAVDTALIKYTVNALAQHLTDPGEILRDLNRIYMTTRNDESSFLVAFLGIINHQTLSFKYASGGHSSAYLRRGSAVEQLAVTGTIIGVREDENYDSRTLRLMQDDLLVLATDGLTEARSANGTTLNDEGAMEWIAQIQTTDPQALVDELVERLLAYSDGSTKDDLAVLALHLYGRSSATDDDILREFTAQ